MTAQTKVTFHHQIANSTCHLQEPGSTKDNPTPVKTCVFHGKPGAGGFYETDIAWEIEQLDKLAKNPQVQVTRIDAELADAATPDRKPADPAIKQAVGEVTAQAALAADPKTVAAQENLAKLLAAGSK